MSVGESGQSFKGYVGLAEESTYGGGAAPTDFIEAVSDGFSGDNQPFYLSTTRGRDTYDAIAGAFEDDGGVDLPVTPEAMGLLLKAAWGSTSVTASDPDGDSTDEVGTHTFTIADDLPSLAVEVGLGSVTAVRHVGVGVESLEIEHSSEERLSMSADLPAQEPDGSVSAVTPSYDNLRALVYHDGTFTFDGTDRSVDVRDVAFSLTNNLTKHTRGSRTPSKMTPGQREVVYDVTLDFANDNIMQKFWGSATATGPEDELFEGSVNVKWESPETIADTTTVYSLELDSPRVVIETHDAQLNEQELIAENVTLRALTNPGGGDTYDVQATLVNGRTSGY